MGHLYHGYVSHNQRVALASQSSHGSPGEHTKDPLSLMHSPKGPGRNQAEPGCPASIEVMAHQATLGNITGISCVKYIWRDSNHVCVD